jgi:SAM-dependent methyltransferase
MASGYKVLPEVYDRWQQAYGKDFSTLILPKLLGTIKTYGIPTSSLLDLACGTGTLAVMMAKRGWRVFGVDASDGMLAEAKHRIEGTPYPIHLSRQNMESFRIPEQVTLAVCMFDAVNHLVTARAMLSAFRRVYDALKPGGCFVFDVNNELCYQTVWQQTEVTAQKDFTIILQNSYDQLTRCAESRVSIFVRKGKLFKRERETVRERYYPEDELGSLLRRAQFQVLESMDFNFTTNPAAGKIKTWWVARRGK